MLDGGVEDVRQADEGLVDRLVAEHDPALAALVADHVDRQDPAAIRGLGWDRSRQDPAREPSA